MSLFFRGGGGGDWRYTLILALADSICCSYFAFFLLYLEGKDVART